MNADEAWVKMANDSRAAANELYRKDRWRSAISRCYYAVFCLITARLPTKVRESRDFESPPHEHLATLAVTHLVHNKQQRRKLMSAIQQLYGLRLQADYRPSVEIDANDTKIALGLMLSAMSMLEKPDAT